MNSKSAIALENQTLLDTLSRHLVGRDDPQLINTYIILNLSVPPSLPPDILQVFSNIPRKQPNDPNLSKIFTSLSQSKLKTP